MARFTEICNLYQEYIEQGKINEILNEKIVEKSYKFRI